MYRALSDSPQTLACMHMYGTTQIILYPLERRMFCYWRLFSESKFRRDDPSCPEDGE